MCGYDHPFLCGHRAPGLSESSVGACVGRTRCQGGKTQASELLLPIGDLGQILEAFAEEKGRFVLKQSEATQTEG